MHGYPFCKLGSSFEFDHAKGTYVLYVWFRPAPNFGQMMGLNLSEAFFFALHQILGKKIGLNLSEDLVFFALHLILGKKSN